MRNTHHSVGSEEGKYTGHRYRRSVPPEGPPGWNGGRRSWYRFLLLATLAATFWATPLAAQVTDEAGARHLPWSGYWWPIAKGELLVPLSKYDYLTQSQAMPWELNRHPPGPQVPGWHGYCHAWAAAAVLEFEPRTPCWAIGRATAQRLLLNVGDQKGLLSASHTMDVANTYGDRFGDGVGGEDPYDIYPDYLWQILSLHIKQQGVPLILDFDPGPEVWNYPVFAYRIEYAPHGPDGQQLGRMSLWAVDDAVPPDHVGMMIHLQTYTFTFRVNTGAVVMRTGRWVGQSAQNHPDFAWYPYVVGTENPHLDYLGVKQLISAAEPVGPVSPAMAGPPSGTNTGPESAVDPGTTPAAGPGVLPNTGGSAPAVLPPGEGPAPRPEMAPGVGSEAGAAPGGLFFPEGVAISPLEMVAAIAEKTSSFGLDITVDRSDGGRYAVGDQCFVRGTSERAGYLYLLYIDSQGGLSVLYPGPNQDNRVTAGQRFVIPPPQAGALLLQEPFGVHRIKAVAVDRQVWLSGLTWPAEEQKGVAPALGRFHWNPTQQAQVRALLQQYQTEQRLSKDLLDGIDVRQRLAAFAQDEVEFYVGPRDESQP